MSAQPGTCLRPAFELRLARGRAYIVRRADRQLVSALSPTEAVLVGLLDGHRSWEEVTLHFLEGFGEEVRPAMRYAFERLGPVLHNGVSSGHPYSLGQLGSVAPPDPREGIRLLPGPRVLHWHVTQYCPRRCAYCYAEPIHGSQAPDATISLERLRVLFSEAAELGANTLLVSGAEPFLREDLPEAIGLAIAAGLAILLTTKFPVTPDIAERLAQAGLRHLAFSIDSLDSDENATLIGSRSYASQMLKAVRNLRSVGVEFSIQSVVTLHNLSSMDAVARFAADEGARVMQLVPFKDVRNPITSLSNSDLRLDDNSVVNEICDRLSRAHRDLKIERFVEASNSGGFHCDIGQTKLLMLPDGVVHRCYKLTSDASLRGADLKQVSLARAWHDPAFVDITLPPARAYAQTVCGSCGSKPNCDTSGRCIYDALINHGRYASPDRNCAGRARLRRPTITIRAI